MKETLYLLTVESGVIFDKLCNVLIQKDNAKFFITEEHHFILKAKKKKLNFAYSIDKNGQENNQLPNMDYRQQENIKNVMHHYNYVIDIKYIEDNKYINIWTFIYNNIQSYKTPLRPMCTDTDEEKIYKSHGSNKQLCLKAILHPINKDNINKLIPKECCDILEDKNYIRLFEFVDNLNENQ